MNFEEAVQVHATWKIKLATYAKNPDGKIQGSDIGADHRCALGQWLYGEGKEKFSSLQEYRTLMSEHARFHRAAGKIADRANSGQTLHAQAMLGGSGEFSAASLNVVKAIWNMKAKVA